VTLDSLKLFEPQQRAHIQIRLKVLTVEDSLQLAAGFFNIIKPSEIVGEERAHVDTLFDFKTFRFTFDVVARSKDEMTISERRET
jgi:hypothetical protein